MTTARKNNFQAQKHGSQHRREMQTETHANNPRKRERTRIPHFVEGSGERVDFVLAAIEAVADLQHTRRVVREELDRGVRCWLRLRRIAPVLGGC